MHLTFMNENKKKGLMGAALALDQSTNQALKGVQKGRLVKRTSNF